jgi:isoleucyl-tRNA synthetase
LTAGFYLVNVLVRDVTDAYENYDVTNATRPVEKFAEQLSTWYVRRSRRRFGRMTQTQINKLHTHALYRADNRAKLLTPAVPFSQKSCIKTLSARWMVPFILLFRNGRG